MRSRLAKKSLELLVQRDLLLERKRFHDLLQAPLKFRVEGMLPIPQAILHPRLEAILVLTLHVKWCVTIHVHTERTWLFVHGHGHLLEFDLWVHVLLNDLCLQADDELAKVHVSQHANLPFLVRRRVGDIAFTLVLEIVDFHYHLALVEEEVGLNRIPWVWMPWDYLVSEPFDLGFNWFWQERVVLLDPLDVIKHDREIFVDNLLQKLLVNS